MRITVRVLALAMCLGGIVRAAEQGDSRNSASEDRWVPRILKIAGLKSLEGKKIDDPAVAGAGLKLEVLDRQTVKSKCPFAIFHGDALYLRVESSHAHIDSADLLDANGVNVVTADLWPRILPLEDGSELRAYPLSAPLDDGMTLQITVLSGVDFKIVTIQRLKDLVGKRVMDPELQRAGMTMEVVDPSPSGTPPNQLLVRQSMFILRLTGPADLLHRMPPPETELVDGWPWGILTGAHWASPTDETLIYMLPKPINNEFVVRFSVLTKSSPSDAAPATMPALSATTPPTGKASEAKIARWIEQLGDQNASVRETATERLSAMGRPALPFLRAAEDAATAPEVRSRLKELIVAADHPPLPPDSGKDPANGVVIPFMPMPGGGKFLRAIDGQRHIRIEKDEDGIRIAVTAKQDGRMTGSYFAAKSLTLLHRDAPQAYQIYYSLCNPDRGEGYPGLEQELKKRMSAANVPEKTQRQIIDELHAVGRARVRVKDADADELDEQQGRWYAEGDKLRAMVDALGVQMPDDLRLPKAPRRRLGINDGPPPPGIASGASVARVQSGSRAEEIGLKVGDVIQKLNGVEIRSSADLAPVMQTEPSKLVIEGLRNGEPFRLEEK